MGSAIFHEGSTLKEKTIMGRPRNRFQGGEGFLRERPVCSSIFASSLTLIATRTAHDFRDRVSPSAVVAVYHCMKPSFPRSFCRECGCIMRQWRCYRGAVWYASPSFSLPLKLGLGDGMAMRMPLLRLASFSNSSIKLKSGDLRGDKKCGPRSKRREGLPNRE